MSVKCFKHSRRDCDECMEPVSRSLTMSEVKYTDALLKAADAMADAIDRTGMVSGDNDPMRIAVANYRALSLGEPQTKENPLETMEWYEGHGKPHPHIPGSKNVVCLNAEDFAEALAGFRDAVKDRDALRAQLTAEQKPVSDQTLNPERIEEMRIELLVPSPDYDDDLQTLCDMARRSLEAPKLRPEVYAFALAMEAKLKANDHKGGWRQTCGTGWLHKRALEETAELRDALGKANNAKAVLEEAADVANFCMMAADVYAIKYPLALTTPSKENL